jgi:hypothetical protein
MPQNLVPGASAVPHCGHINSLLGIVLSSVCCPMQHIALCVALVLRKLFLP